MRLGAQGWCTEMTLRDEMGREEMLSINKKINKIQIGEFPKRQISYAYEKLLQIFHQGNPN